MPMLKKPRANCMNCGIENPHPGYKYCSNKCQSDLKFRQYIERWQQGLELGLQNHGVVSRHIKRYLRDKFNNRCAICGWSRTNPITGAVPLVADHIDGNWKNNIESNLRLICPNCDSLTATYAGLNRGKGRAGRVVSNRVRQGRLMVR